MGGLFFVVFLGAQFSYIFQFRAPFEVQFGNLFGVPGNLGNRLKTMKGIRFSHFGVPFCKDAFRPRSGGCFFIDFYYFYHFLDPFWGVFWDKKVKKWGVEKQAKKKSNIFMQVIPGNPGSGPMWSLKRT